MKKNIIAIIVGIIILVLLALFFRPMAATAPAGDTSSQSDSTGASDLTFAGIP